jgi:GT2 family glycosyltransferase
MRKLPTVSVVIPTRDRSTDLSDLLSSILNQDYLPVETIVVDDSLLNTTEQVVASFVSKFESVNCRLKYLKGNDGLTAARNLGVKFSEGDSVLFLDDDTLLDRNVISVLASFLNDNPKVLGVQPNIVSNNTDVLKGGISKKFGNALYKALMVIYYEKNKLSVRRSGMSIFPNDLTTVVIAQRFSGCCCCYRREVFTNFSFDTNLKRWGSKEDLDFSYRVSKKNPESLYVIPYANVTHKISEAARLPTKLSIYMVTIYWFYVFFKDVYDHSILNLMAFLWALVGNVVTVIGELSVKKKSKPEWWSLIYLLRSYGVAFKNLRKIMKQSLDFFNKDVK